MTKQGYLIAKNNLTEAFFTSTSAYDRPQWVAAEKATCYLTVELAESALKKLLRNGSYSAKVLPTSEAISLEMPDEEQQELPPADPNQPPIDGEEGQNEVDGEAEDDMVAQDQSGDPDAPPEGDGNPGDAEIEAEVDQLLGNETDPEVAADAEADDEVGSEDAAGVENADPDFDLRPAGGEELPVDGEEDLDAEELPVRESTMLGMTQIKPLAVSNPASEEPLAGEQEEKVKVPADAMRELRAVKAEYERQAKFSSTRDDTHATFALTVAGAMEELIDLLSQGTVGGVKSAQIKLSSLMSPILHLVPDSAVKFIHSGGRKPTLKDLFDLKRFDKKSK